MKYLPLRDIDIVTNALNFSTPDCHIIGGCDIYTTKAAGGDKKLYKNIENSLESQYESLIRLSASLSPPRNTANDDSKSRGKDGRSKRSGTADSSEIDLSRASPFGSFNQITARRTFAYLIATLNASHPDYDFSHLLRPSDFHKERSLRAVMNNIDSTLYNLRPKQTAALHNHYHLSPSPLLSNSAPNGGPGYGSDVWSHNTWKLIDKEMALRQCEKYSYVPDDDPFDGEEGSIWSMHYFFFNKERKRVCYLYLRGFSVISHSPVHAPAAVFHSASSRAKPTALLSGFDRPKKLAVSAASQLSSISEGAGKRAEFWLGDELLSRNVRTVGGYGDEDDEDYNNNNVAIEAGMMEEDDEDEVEVPFMNLDDVRSGLVDGGWRYSLDEEEEDDDDEEEEEKKNVATTVAADSTRHVRGISEEIGEAMDLEL